MNETKNKKFDLKSFLLRTLTDPVLWYTVLIMTALMYHYRNRDTVKTDDLGYVYALGWGLCSLFIGWIIFRVFDYMKKHNFLGFFMYTALAVVFGAGVRKAIIRGKEAYPITWGLWFLTPQDSLEFNFWYAAAFYLLFMLFMGSVIYYFTRVRYRIFMNFLIFIIPFSIYGKEYEKMPTVFIILLAVGYILLMVYYRQLTDTESTVFVERRKSWKPIAVYAVIFAAAAAIFPKPAVVADRTVLETLIDADQFTDKLNAMLDVFRDTSTGDQFRSNEDQTLVYEVRADEPLRIKTATRSTYDFENDRWSIEDMDSRFSSKAGKPPVNIGAHMGIAGAVLEAASLDSEFSEKYGLAEFVKSGLDEPELREAAFYSLSAIVGMSQGTDMAPVPQFAVEMTNCSRRGDVVALRGGTVYAVDSRFATDEKYTFSYDEDTFFMSSRNNEFIDQLAQFDYEELLEDTSNVLYMNLDDSSSEDYRQKCRYADLDCALYEDYLEYLLDYGGKTDIKALADEITQDCKTEYEKALAIEAYFYNNNYVYDLKYRKGKGENAEDFLFRTKTGVCYEYATSMVLLARAAGIPARYCEGYNMTEHIGGKYAKDTNYTIRAKDLHGFPELYIRGYGWASFEPTVTDIAETGEKKASTATDMLSYAGLMILAGAMLVLLFAFVYPMLSHKWFIFRGKKRMPNDAVKAVMHRICKVYGIENVNTSKEAAALVHEMSGADITDTAELFDRSVYGDVTLNEQEKEKAMNEYIRAYDEFRESRKRRRIKSR
ncbi:transglutaminase-like domain-containing protein [Ruminococcus flavefaciens]|uniref:Transglutaminase-like superfamily protein n=1 Tax=Ruminococcus flavefaciens TaxID=1265 RepID=A0A1K1NCW8_RUMFL|nr:transglutaminase-like domain-containing protein [Ruminococcus flavefaciens]SFW33312.1 Transglutaminase-like superfamily protein [Ruminococcus flavefaciens]